MHVNQVLQPACYVWHAAVWFDLMPMIFFFLYVFYVTTLLQSYILLINECNHFPLRNVVTRPSRCLHGHYINQTCHLNTLLDDHKQTQMRVKKTTSSS